MKQTKDKLLLALSMFIFGSIGIFRNMIPFSSSAIVFFRSAIGFLCLIFFIKKENLKQIKSNLILLIFSGIFLAANWILLFEAYVLTNVATATLCYYMAPIIITLISPLFGEKITVKKTVCIVIALGGMALVSGLFSPSDEKSEFLGVLLALGAAVLYALVVILNKKITVAPVEKTASQFLVAFLMLIPYTLLTDAFSGCDFSIKNIILLLIIGTVHTAGAYVLYFGSIKKVGLQTSAIMSYIDPIVAVILSFIIEQTFSLASFIGAVLIIGALVISEIDFKGRSQIQE